MANNTEEMNLAEAREMMDSFAAVNLDEVSPETVKVALHEYVEDRKAPAGYRVEVVHKDIETFVPMFMFNRMLANQKRVAKLRKSRREKPEDGDETEEDDFDFLAEDEPNFTKLTDEMFNDILRESEPAIVWQAKEVLNVWRLTPGEQDMTLKKLLLGLDLPKIEGLFTRFFGGMLRRR